MNFYNAGVKAIFGPGTNIPKAASDIDEIRAMRMTVEQLASGIQQGNQGVCLKVSH